MNIHQQAPAGCYTATADGVWQRRTATAFGYSDGDAVESRLLDALRRSRDVGLFSEELRALQTDWPSTYHLTALRGNLLRPFQARLQGASVLELGAGCGAITRFLGESGADVLAVEGSPRRASIVVERCRDLPRVQVVADRIEAFETHRRFDVVTLIGVLEYARVFVEAPDPVQRLLEVAVSFLAPGGVLLLAIENQLGLKYFHGSAEDHLGRAMFGINDSYGPDTAVTFGRRELAQRVQRAGLACVDHYVPLPDYKTPVSMLYPAGLQSSDAAPGWDPSPLLAGSAVFDQQRPAHPSFSLEMAWQVVGRNGLAADLANSFLMACGRQGADVCTTAPGSADAGSPVVLAAHYGGPRVARFARETQFVLRDGMVATRTRKTGETRALGQASWVHEPYLPGRLWIDELLQIVNRPGWTVDALVRWAEVWIGALRAEPAAAPDTAGPGLRKFSHLLAPRYLDAAPFNFIVDASGRGRFFDLEWSYSTAVPLEFVVLRGLYLSFDRVTSCARPAAGMPAKQFDLAMQVMEACGLVLDLQAGDLDAFVQVFNGFQNHASGRPADEVHAATRALGATEWPVRRLYT